MYKLPKNLSVSKNPWRISSSIIFLCVFALSSFGYSETGLLQFKSYISSPINEMSILWLIPRADITSAECTDGTLYVNNNGDLRICPGPYTPSYIWATDNNHNLFPTKTSSHPEINVGIGLTNPFARLVVSEKNGQDSDNSIVFRPADNLQNSAIVLTTKGAPTPTPAYFKSQLNFKIGEGASLLYGQIKYHHNPALGPNSGLAFNASINPVGPENSLYPYELWIDSTGLIGIGTYQPTEKLTVEGDLQANRLFLKSNGTDTGRLQASYDPANGGGFYADFAP